ncbi:hypothetical protein ACJX0J_035545 [Zea mays]
MNLYGLNATMFLICATIYFFCSFFIYHGLNGGNIFLAPFALSTLLDWYKIEMTVANGLCQVSQLKGLQSLSITGHPKDVAGMPMFTLMGSRIQSFISESYRMEACMIHEIFIEGPIQEK